MYKNFTLTESEREEILNHHKQYGYKQPINESRYTSPTGTDYFPDEDEEPEMEPELPKRKPMYERIVFNNGGKVSIQASHTHYCKPRNDEGPYRKVELGYPTKETKIPEEMLPYLEQGFDDDPYDGVYPYTPISIVKKLIELNGGIKSGELPPFAEGHEDMDESIEPTAKGGDKEVIVKQAEDATNMLSPEEKNILANYIQTHGEKSIVNIVKNELNGGEGEFNEEMDEKEFKIRTIIDKIINKTVAASAIGIVPAAMFISGGVGVALGITALVGLTLKDAAWWGGKGPHSLHYKEADKSRKDWYNGKPDIKPTKKYYSDEDEMSEEQPMDELTLGMGDPNFKQSHETKYSPEQQHEMDTISELVNDAVGDSLSSRNIKDIIEDIEADYLNGNMNGGDVYDYVNEYLKDWVREARSASPSGHESGSRLTRDENGTIWGSDWQSVIDRATQKPEPDDDDIFNGHGSEGGVSYGSSSGFDGRTMNEAKEILKANFKRFL